MRLFFAVTIPPEVLLALEKVRADLRRAMECPSIRWVRPEQFHYTVKFLGEQTMPRAQKAVEVAEKVCDKLAPFRLTLGGLGAFPTPRRPSVLWIGATSGAQEFERMARLMDDALAREHFRRESKVPTAHLTIARIKTYEAESAVADGLARLNLDEIATITVDSMVLMRSTLRPTGSEYSLVERFPFRGEHPG